MSAFAARISSLPRPLRFAVFGFPLLVGGRAIKLVVQNYIHDDGNGALIMQVDESHARVALFGVPVKPVHAEVPKVDGGYITNDPSMVAHWYMLDGETRRQLVGFTPQR